MRALIRRNESSGLTSRARAYRRWGHNGTAFIKTMRRVRAETMIASVVVVSVASPPIHTHTHIRIEQYVLLNNAADIFLPSIRNRDQPRRHRFYVFVCRYARARRCTLFFLLAVSMCASRGTRRIITGLTGTRDKGLDRIIASPARWPMSFRNVRLFRSLFSLFSLSDTPVCV